MCVCWLCLCVCNTICQQQTCCLWNLLSVDQLRVLRWWVLSTLVLVCYLEQQCLLSERTLYHLHSVVAACNPNTKPYWYCCQSLYKSEQTLQVKHRPRGVGNHFPTLVSAFFSTTEMLLVLYNSLAGWNLKPCDQKMTAQWGQWYHSTANKIKEGRKHTRFHFAS